MRYSIRIGQQPQNAALQPHGRVSDVAEPGHIDLGAVKEAGYTAIARKYGPRKLRRSNATRHCLVRHSPALAQCGLCGNLAYTTGGANETNYSMLQLCLGRV
jgi:hypothetical protein